MYHFTCLKLQFEHNIQSSKLTILNRTNVLGQNMTGLSRLQKTAVELTPPKEPLVRSGKASKISLLRPL